MILGDGEEKRGRRGGGEEGEEERGGRGGEGEGEEERGRERERDVKMYVKPTPHLKLHPQSVVHYINNGNTIYQLLD